MVGECVKAKFVDHSTSAYRSWDIVRDMKQDFGVDLPYVTAWRSKECALSSLRGDDAESYQGIIYYGENPMLPNCIAYLSTVIITLQVHSHFL